MNYKRLEIEDLIFVNLKFIKTIEDLYLKLLKKSFNNFEDVKSPFNYEYDLHKSLLKAILQRIA